MIPSTFFLQGSIPRCVPSLASVSISHTSEPLLTQKISPIVSCGTMFFSERWRILGIFGLSLAPLLGGCKSCSVEQPSFTETAEACAAPASQWIRKEKVELEGDPSFGTVYYIRQSHNVPGLERADPLRYDEILRYQYEIYKELERLRPKYLFREDSHLQLPDGRAREAHLTQQFGRPFYDWMRETVSGPLPENFDRLSDEQKRLLADYEGFSFYHLRHDDVGLFNTTTLDEFAKIDAMIKQLEIELREEAAALKLHVHHHPRLRPIVYDLRESIAVREIKRFLEQHAGAKIALIFGRNHEFRDDFEKFPRPPRLISISFDPAGNGP